MPPRELNLKEIREICDLYESTPVKIKDIAKTYGVSRNTIYNIVRNRSPYREVKVEDD